MCARLGRGVASGLRPRVVFLEVAVFYLNIRGSCFYLLVHVDVGAGRGVLTREKGLHAGFLLREVSVFPRLVAQRWVRSDVGVFAAFVGALDVVFGFLDRCALLTIWSWTFNLFEHDRETSQPVLVTELPLLPETALVVVEGLLPLSSVRTVRHVRSVGDHVEERLALVADWWHVFLLFLEAVLVLLPPFAELDVAELGYLRQLLLGVFLVLLGAGCTCRHLGLRHKAVIGFSLVHLENVFVSCSSDRALLARVSVFRRFVRGAAALSDRM